MPSYSRYSLNILSILSLTCRVIQQLCPSPDGYEGRPSHAQLQSTFRKPGIIDHPAYDRQTPARALKVSTRRRAEDKTFNGGCQVSRVEPIVQRPRSTLGLLPFESARSESMREQLLRCLERKHDQQRDFSFRCRRCVLACPCARAMVRR